MSLLARLFSANKFEKTDQGCVRGNGLPFSHDALRIDNFSRQHGATVHGKLQDVNHFFAAIHFHVCTSGHKKSTALRLLWRSVIEQAPERSNGAVSFDGAIVDINNARICVGDFLPFGVCGHRRYQGNQHAGKSYSPLKSAKESAFSGRIFQSVFNSVHARYYKVVPTS